MPNNKVYISKIHSENGELTHTDLVTFSQFETTSVLRKPILKTSSFDKKKKIAKKTCPWAHPSLLWFGVIQLHFCLVTRSLGANILIVSSRTQVQKM